METTVTKQVNISQSLIKAFADYKNAKECGKQFEAKYINGQSFPSSDVQRLGQWFEYKATGAPARGGVIPEPDRTQKGELMAPYKKMEKQVENFKKAMTHYGLTILRVGFKLEHKGIEGTVDIEAIATKDIYVDGEIIIHQGEKVFIDLKSSGLLNDKWNELGWELESFTDKDKILIQAVHYKLLSVLKYGREYAFLFFVFSNTNEIDSAIRFIRLDETRLTEHVEVIRKVRISLKKELEAGFTALPELNRCSKCPLFENCSERAEVAKIEIVHY